MLYMCFHASKMIKVTKAMEQSTMGNVHGFEKGKVGNVNTGRFEGCDAFN